MPWVRAPQSAIRVKVTLKGLRPPVWRRLLVEDTMTLGHLHLAVQAAMGWENSHLHVEGEVGGVVGAGTHPTCYLLSKLTLVAGTNP